MSSPYPTTPVLPPWTVVQSTQDPSYADIVFTSHGGYVLRNIPMDLAKRLVQQANYWYNNIYNVPPERRNQNV